MVNGDEGTESWNNIAAHDADAYVDLGADRKWKNGYDTLVKLLSVSNCL